MKENLKIQEFNLKQIAENLNRIPRNGKLSEDFTPLTKEEKRKLMELVSNFNEYGKALRCETALLETLSTIGEITKLAETYALTVSKFNAEVPTSEEVPLCVEDVFNPRWSYGGSKITGELLFINYAKHYGFDYSIIRYHNIYGPRMGYEHVIPEFCTRLLNEEAPFKIFGGENTRAFCYIKDAVDATIKVMKSKETNSKVIHIGNSKEEISIRELAEKLMSVADKKTEIKILEEAKGSVKRRCPNTNKLSELTGFEAKVMLEEGLKETWNWYKKDFEVKK